MTSNFKVSTNAETNVEDRMKLLATLTTFFLLITSNAQAIDRVLQANVRSQVENYYAATGDWSLVKVKNIEQVEAGSLEFILMSAKAHVLDMNTGKHFTETCLVTFIQHNNEFYAINCF